MIRVIKIYYQIQNILKSNILHQRSKFCTEKEEKLQEEAIEPETTTDNPE